MTKLVMMFLGCTEAQVDQYQPFGNALKKVGKKPLDANMEMILYVLSQCQQFLLIIDKDYGGKVVTQKTFWPDLDKIYNTIKQRAIPGMTRWDSDGFYMNSPQLGNILVEICHNLGDPDCICASINV